MAIVLEELLLQLQSTGGATVASDIKNVSNSLDDVGNKANRAGSEFNFATSGIFSFVAGVTAATAAITGLVVAFVGLSGSKMAGTLEQINAQMRSLFSKSNSSDIDELIGKIEELGNSRFGTNAAEWAKRFGEAGENARMAARDVNTLVHTAAGAHLNVGTANQLSAALQAIEMRPQIQARGLSGLRDAGIDVQAVIEAGTGRKFRDVDQAERSLVGMEGAKAYGIIMNGLDKLFGNASLSGGTFLEVLGNLYEIMQRVMAPTGALINGLLAPFAVGLQHIAKALEDINKWLGGLPGLVVVIAAFIRMKGLLITSYRAATVAIQRLTAALWEMSEAAGYAAGTAGAAAAGTAVNAGASAVAGGAAAAGLGGTIKAAISAGLKTAGGGGIKAVGVVGIVSTLVDWLANMGADKLQASGHGTGATYLRDMADFGSLGATIGAFFGPLGIAIVGGLGLIGGAIKGYFDDKANNKKDPDTKRAADALEDIRGKLIGGGQRARMTGTDLELEHALARLMVPGGAGAG